MPSWNELLEASLQLSDGARTQWLVNSMNESLRAVGTLRGSEEAPRNVILYASAFLQKGGVPQDRLMITFEDLNGLMSVVYGMDCTRGLTLLLHTPGGMTNAAESLVAYLRSKFKDFEVIVPTLAMSAGTMIALASDRIVMGRQSQLGPIDPQLTIPPGRAVSARAVVDQFDRACREVLENQQAAHVWAPVVASLGPSLLVEAQNNLDYSESMVAHWVAQWMLSAEPDPVAAGQAVAHHFNDANAHKSHGRRIDRDEARGQSVRVEDLEESQPLQEAVLTAYHLMTIMFEQGPMTKMLWSDKGRTWIKNWIGAATPPGLPEAAI
jgi:hypothetical protein